MRVEWDAEWDLCPSLLGPMRCEDTVQRQLSLNQKVGSHYTAGILIVDFSAPRAVRNKISVIYKPPSL
jgi:hypothetical protein